MSWESEIDGSQNAWMDRWNSIKYHETMETQLKLGHRSKLIQSQSTNMQIEIQLVINKICRKHGADGG